MKHAISWATKVALRFFELLILNEMVKDAILSHRSSYEIRRISAELNRARNATRGWNSESASRSDYL